MIKFDTYEAMLYMCKDLNISPFPSIYETVVKKKDLKRIMYFEILENARGPFDNTYSYVCEVGDKLGVKPSRGYSSSIYDSSKKVLQTLVDKDFV